ncbi:MAG: hypothetical protein UR60_C0018G0018 [Candidatus Moranbacteria bacterium GW2011_GWF2_34_56]|nr:MAG: hypothetical protein UR51_C0021G0018 [Candidatus Moranbacteria bacterium GW2011_GWF1_34_10]KKP64631.1 MAG: hypothetical protein UR60_C0018G0018 [Candidatus Moranbacteria bacterium GW2011_GWF2_34_56]HBI17126.1 hypothetical protein [Candidatus Moranbacteria bacterium]
MYKEVTEELIRKKVAETLKERDHWKRICLLILLLLKPGKLASRYFIYDKIQEWELWNLLYDKGIEDTVTRKEEALTAISRTLQNLFLNRFLKKEDLGRQSLPQKEFEKICAKRVLGRPEERKIKPNQKWLQSAFKLSPIGRRLARGILFPSRKKTSSKLPRAYKKGGNHTPNARA